TTTLRPPTCTAERRGCQPHSHEPCLRIAKGRHRPPHVYPQAKPHPPLPLPPPPPLHQPLAPAGGNDLRSDSFERIRSRILFPCFLLPCSEFLCYIGDSKRLFASYT